MPSARPREHIASAAATAHAASVRALVARDRGERQSAGAQLTWVTSANARADTKAQYGRAHAAGLSLAEVGAILAIRDSGARPVPARQRPDRPAPCPGRAAHSRTHRTCAALADRQRRAAATDAADRAETGICSILAAYEHRPTTRAGHGGIHQRTGSPGTFPSGDGGRG